MLVDLLTRKKESIDGFSVLVDSYGELILLYLEAQNLRKQIKRKHYYEKVEEKEYKNIDDAIIHMPNENIYRIFMNDYWSGYQYLWGLLQEKYKWNGSCFGKYK